MIESTLPARVTVEIFIGLCIPSWLSDEVHLTAVKRSHERFHVSPSDAMLTSDTGDRQCLLDMMHYSSVLIIRVAILTCAMPVSDRVSEVVGVLLAKRMFRKPA